MSDKSKMVNGQPRKTNQSTVSRLTKEMKAMRVNKFSKRNVKNFLNVQKKVSRPLQQKSVASAYSSGQSSGVAKIVRAQDGSVRVVHRELLVSIIGTANFNILAANTFPLNPGVQASFPWLSNLAMNFEFYRFNKLKYCYYTRTGSNIPGSVMLVPDYDAADAAPTNEQVASSYEDVQEDAPWKDIECNLSPRSLNATDKEKYVRTGALAPNQDIKTFDSGNFFCATIDGTAVNWGKLWVEYDVSLFKPQMPNTGFGGNGVLTGGGTQSQTAPFGTAAIGSGSYNLSANGLVVSGSGLNIGAEYVVSAWQNGTVITQSLAIASAIGLTAKTVCFNGFPVAATSSGSIETFTATASNFSITFINTATTVTSSGFFISQVIPTLGY
jgi:hypothetical protein